MKDSFLRTTICLLSIRLLSVSYPFAIHPFLGFQLSLTVGKVLYVAPIEGDIDVALRVGAKGFICGANGK